MKKIICFFIITMLVGVMLISIVSFYKDYSEDKKQEEVYEKLISIAEQAKEDTEENITNNNIDETINTTEEMDYTELFNKNSDMVGWIKIENTNINYPVMQTKNRPNYYLNKNFYKEYSAWRNSIYTRKL